MIEVNDIKNGMTLMIEGNIYQVVEFLHVKPGKGSAFMKMKLRNLRTGALVEVYNIYIILVIHITLWICKHMNN